MRTLYDLLAATSTKLAGQPVTVRLQQPATKGMTGECHRSEGGRLIIDIKPDLSDETFLYVWAHETAHAKLHEFARSTVHKHKAGTLKPSEKTTNYLTHEDQADTLAKRWISYGQDHADPNLGDLEGPLWALYQKD